MPIIVQKFGGTSVADTWHIHLAARQAVRAKLAGNQVVIVVSAMGKTTDGLVKLAYQVTRRPAKREMDMLISTGEQVSIALVAMAIHEAGHEAISMTGAQIGMMTDSRHTEARIRSINTERIRRQLDQNRIVIVAGFQGVDPDFNITTLGRGGSDTTAVALAAALHADACEVYTDVSGVYTADPRLVPEARRLEAISYDEMLELAWAGARVMHPRSIELGRKYNVPIHVRSSFTDDPGTVIMSDPPEMENPAVRTATLKTGVSRVTIYEIPNQVGVAATIFSEIGSRSINIDDIIETTSDAGRNVIVSFTVDALQADMARTVAESIARRFGGAKVEVTDNIARLRIVGMGMRAHSGVAAKLFKAIATEGINIENISTSEIAISILVPEKDGERALRAVHKAFGLEQEPRDDQDAAS